MSSFRNKMIFRKKILEASRMLTNENMAEIKYLLKAAELGDGVLESVNNTTGLFDLLEKSGIFSEGHMDDLYDILNGIKRTDVVDFLDGNGQQKKEFDRGKLQEALKQQKKDKDPIAEGILDLVANLVAADWKRNARFLKLPEEKIDQIDMDHRKTYERARQSLQCWIHNNKDPTWGALKKSLEQLPRHDIVRRVETKFPQSTRAQGIIQQGVAASTPLQDTKDEKSLHSATVAIPNSEQFPDDSSVVVDASRGEQFPDDSSVVVDASRGEQFPNDSSVVVDASRGEQFPNDSSVVADASSGGSGFDSNDFSIPIDSKGENDIEEAEFICAGEGNRKDLAASLQNMSINVQQQA